MSVRASASIAVLRIVGAMVPFSCAGGLDQAFAQTDPPLTTIRVASGFTQPLLITHAPGDSTRLFVVERTGRIRIIQYSATGAATVLPTPFLDVSTTTATSWLEWGILGLCFHPNFATNGVFYINRSILPNADSVIESYRVSAANANVADPASRTVVLYLTQPNMNHRGGWMDFGPDGFFYATFGDGGGQSDPNARAQNTMLLQGKLLRLDVDGADNIPMNSDDDGYPADINKNYTVPVDNPFVGRAGFLPELWAYGLRNPWRCSFDRETHDLWIGDVGQNTREEIDFQPAGVGGQNYGWRCTEGTFCTGLSGCTCNGPTLTPPFYEYTHSVGLSVTGGYVYRGCVMPWLRGTYFFAEYQNNRLFSIKRAANGTATSFVDRTTELQPQTAGQNLQGVAGMGEDYFGEIFYCDYNGGEVFKLVQRTAPPDCNHNNIADACEIAFGRVCDNDLNGVPDGCQTPRPCPADWDGDCGVSIEDLLAYLNDFGQGFVVCDLDNGSMTGQPDGGVTLDDLLFYLFRFSLGC